MQIPTLRIAVLACVLALPAAAQDAPPTEAPPDPLADADSAARAFDYEAAIAALETAIAVRRGQDESPTEDLANLTRRQAMYERILGLPALIDLARENPGKLVGCAATRGGKQLAGRIQLFELGAVEGAGIGNRILGGGTLKLRVGEGEIVSLDARRIACVRVTWARPEESGGRDYWSVGQVRIVLQNGEAVEGAATWVLPISSLSVREPGADEDTTINVFPVLGGECNPEDLVAEVLIIGAPPDETPALATPEETQ